EKIAGKNPSGSSTAERNDAPASPAQSADKTDTPPAGSADKQLAEPGKTDESPDTPALSPELAAMIAGLLQRHEATGEVTPADEKAGDPLALLGKALGRHDGDMPETPADLLDARDTAAGKTNAAMADAELDLHAALSRGAVTDTASEEAPSTEFSSTLNQLNQAAQAGAARNTQAAAPHVIAPRVGAQGWDQAVAQRMVWMVSGAEQSASLTLNPPELGP